MSPAHLQSIAHVSRYECRRLEQDSRSRRFHPSGASASRRLRDAKHTHALACERANRPISAHLAKAIRICSKTCSSNHSACTHDAPVVSVMIGTRYTLARVEGRGSRVEGRALHKLQPQQNNSLPPPIGLWLSVVVCVCVRVRVCWRVSESALRLSANRPTLTRGICAETSGSDGHGILIVWWSASKVMSADEPRGQSRIWVSNSDGGWQSQWHWQS